MQGKGDWKMYCLRKLLDRENKEIFHGLILFTFLPIINFTLTAFKGIAYAIQFKHMQMQNSLTVCKTIVF